MYIVSCTLMRNEIWCWKGEEFGYNPVWRFARDALINDPQTGWFGTMGVYYLTVLESTNLKSRCQQCVLSESSRGESFLASSYFWGVPAIPAAPWLVATRLCSLPFTWHSPGVSVSKFPSSYKDTFHWDMATLFWNDLNLT